MEVSKKKQEDYRKSFIVCEPRLYWSIWISTLPPSLSTFLVKSRLSLYFYYWDLHFLFPFFWNLRFLVAFLLKCLISFHFPIGNSIVSALLCRNLLFVSIEIPSFAVLSYWNFYLLFTLLSFTFLFEQFLSHHFSFQISTLASHFNRSF